VSDNGAFDRTRLGRLLAAERDAYAQDHPRSAALFADASHLIGRVPMTWMGKWAGGFPLFLESAHGATLTDVDGHEYVDFALGDTGAMAGHSPQPTVAAVRARMERGGMTTMLPTDDAEWVGAELARRFGLPLWSFTLSATDANRWALRIARRLTGRDKILVFSHCYHGSVDETFAVSGPGGEAVSRPGNVGPAVDPVATTRVAEFNDLDGVERALAAGDVAAVLTEPALTNIGIVAPEPGFLNSVAALARVHGALLVIDETHTFSAGPGGATAAWGLEPDLLTIGKAIGGGIACGAFGMRAELAERILADTDADLVDVGGVGGTLAGNALSLAAVRATLGEVLTDAAFEHMIGLATSFTAGVRSVIERYGAPWSVTQLGARTEYRFGTPAPVNGTDSAALEDEELADYLHLACANRGILLTPFHNMALMSPATTHADVDRHTTVFEGAVAELFG
jgi:glutamate-1-semialdehyde 2,1-aminomutase